MKRIISLIVVSALLFGLCACNSVEDVEQNERSLAQMEIIDGFNVSVENRKIVGYQGENDHLKYIVVEYDENAQKSSETVYYFCFNESVFTKTLNELEGEPVLTAEEEALYITVKSNIAITGSYQNDLKRIKSEYTVK